jgi:hypothetical protein
MPSDQGVHVGEVWAYGPGSDVRTVVGLAAGSTPSHRVFIVRHPEKRVPRRGRGRGFVRIKAWESCEPEWLILKGVRVDHPEANT